MCNATWFTNNSLPTLLKWKPCLVNKSLLLKIWIMVTWLKALANLHSLLLKGLMKLLTWEYFVMSCLGGTLIRTILVWFTFLIKFAIFLNAVSGSSLSMSFAPLQIIKKSFFVRLHTSSFSLHYWPSMWSRFHNTTYIKTCIQRSSHHGCTTSHMTVTHY
jgi:hypothetical protein